MNERPPCSTPGCTRRTVRMRTPYGVYLCDACWSEKRLAAGQIKKCAVKGCTRPVYMHGLCTAHRSRLQRGAPLDAPIKPARLYQPGDVCSEPGCTERPTRRGKCSRHYKLDYDQRRREEKERRRLERSAL